MTTATTTTEAIGSVADWNRQTLREAGVFTVSLVGGPGCGKSTLIQRVVQRMAPELRFAVIAAGPQEHAAIPGRGMPPGWNVVYVNGGSAACLDAALVGDAIDQLDLASLDLLIIENVGTLIVPEECRDLGQDVTVTILSVAAGDDKARKHPELIEAADAVVLNKVDLSLVVPFDLGAFRADVQRINPRAKLFEVSALTDRGIDSFIAWLTRRTNKGRDGEDVSHWFG